MSLFFTQKYFVFLCYNQYIGSVLVQSLLFVFRMKSLILFAMVILNFCWSDNSNAQVSAPVRARLDFLVNKTSKVEGPNCWNESTYVAGISKGLHHTTGNEFGFLMDSPLCAPISLETAQAGDIVALRRVDRNDKVIPVSMISEVHGYSYVDSKMGLTKNGTMKENAYELMSHDDIYSFYRKSEYVTCKQFGLERVDCKLRTFAYRCQDIESYLSQRGEMNAPEKALLAQISAFEKILQKSVLSGKSLSAKETNMTATFINQVKALESQGRSQFLIDYLYLRIESIETRSW